MRTLCKLALLMFAFAAQAQRIDWNLIQPAPIGYPSRFYDEHGAPRAAHPSRAQQRAILQHIRHSAKFHYDIPDHPVRLCTLDPESTANYEDNFGCLRFWRVPTDAHGAIEVDIICPSENPLFYLLRFDSGHLLNLSEPGGMDGYVSVLEKQTLGLHDLLSTVFLGLSARHITYLRFNGFRYQAVAAEIFSPCVQPGHGPSDEHWCFPNGKRAWAITN